MKTFEELYANVLTRLSEDVTPVTSPAPVQPVANGTAPTPTPATTTANPSQSATPTPPAETNTNYDANHTIVQQLAKTTNPADIVKVLQTNGVALPTVTK